MTLNVPDALLTSVPRKRSVETKTGIALYRGTAALLVIARAGRYLAIAMCDLADPQVRRFAQQSLLEGSTRVLLLGKGRQASVQVSTKGPLEQVLRASGEQEPSTAETFVEAVRHAIASVSTTKELARMGVDARDEGGGAVWTRGELLVESVRRFKGQAASAIVLTECDFEALEPMACRLLFVGMTRARMHLEWVVSRRPAETITSRILASSA